jgi:hypothetical protein
MDLATVRRMWVATEHVHLVTYFAPEVPAAYEAAGITGFWRGYFGGRAAPMGAVGAGPVEATFYGFHREFVAKAVPDVWERATPAVWITAREQGAGDALRRVLGGLVPHGCADVAAQIDAALRGCSPAGRTLFAANLDVAVPDDPITALWQACTSWREHRGDGHIAALVGAEVDGCESHVLRLAVAGGDDALMRAVRGWSDDDWAAAAGRLADRGLVGADGAATDAGRALLAEVEASTDRLASAPVELLGAADVEAALAVLEPIAHAVRTAMTMPDPNPIGVPAP